jgi:hypothetical protein
MFSFARLFGARSVSAHSFVLFGLAARSKLVRIENKWSARALAWGLRQRAADERNVCREKL